MKRQIRILLLAVVLILILVCATMLYRNLTDLSAALPAETAPVAEIPVETAHVQETTEAPGEADAGSSADLAPDFEVTSNEGDAVRLSGFIGQPVVVNFWATWCGYCKLELPAFEAAFSEYGDTVRFMMLDITDGSRETESLARAYVEENGYTFPVYFDAALDATRTYGVYSIPMTVFVNADGSIASTHIGAMTEAELMLELQSILPATK